MRGKIRVLRVKPIPASKELNEAFTRWAREFLRTTDIEATTLAEIAEVKREREDRALKEHNKKDD